MQALLCEQGSGVASADPGSNGASSTLDAAESEVGSPGGWWFTDWLGWGDNDATGDAALTTDGASASGSLTRETLDGTTSSLSGQASLTRDGDASASGSAHRGHTAHLEHATDDWERRSSQASAEGSWSRDDGGSATVGRTSEHVVHYKGHEVTSTSEASLSGDAESIGAKAGSATRIDDDGVVRETAATGGASWSADTGGAASFGYEQSVSDGDDYQTSRQVQSSIDAGSARVSGGHSARYTDLDGRQVQESDTGLLGFDWETGFLASYGESASWARGDDHGERNASIGYEDGGLAASMSGAEQLTADDGAVHSSSYTASATANDQGLATSASRTSGYSADGIEGVTSFDGAAGTDADGGYSMRAAASRSVSDGEEYHDRSSAEVTVDTGTLTMGASSDVRYTDAHDVVHDNLRSGSVHASATELGVNVSESMTQTDDGVASGTSTTGNLTWSAEDGAGYTARRERTVSQDDDYSNTRSADVSISGDGVSFGAGDSATWQDVDGTERSEATRGGIGFDGDAASLEGARTSSVTNADGSSRTDALSGSMSTDGTMQGSWSSTSKDADGNVTGGASARGRLQVSEDELGAGFGVTRTFSEGRSVSGGGDYTYKIAEPAQVGDVWVVEFRQTLSANAGAGLQGKGVGGGATLAGQVVSGGSRTFATEAEARAFYDRPDVALMEGPSADVADVLAMQTGDSQMTMRSGQIGANGTASAGMVSFEAGAAASASHGLTVTRANGDAVLVRIDDAEALAGNLGMSTTGVGMGASRSVEQYEGTTYRFDLSVPAAQAAYTALVQGGEPPAEQTSGVRVEESRQGTKQTDTADVQLGGLSMTHGSTLEESETVLANGDTAEQSTGGRFMSAVWEMFGFNQSESHELTLTEVNDTDRFLTGTAVVDTSSANATHSGLARAAGVLGAANTAEGDSSGRWTVESVFPPEAADAFVAAVKAGEVNPHDGLIIGDAGKEMIEGILAAGGDTDAERRIVATFVSEEGAAAIQAIRQNVAGEEEYLHLDGSETFEGYAGHREFEDAAERLEALAGTDGYDVQTAFREVEALDRKQRARLLDLQDWSRYPDLPRALRQEEIARTERHVERTTRLIALIGVDLADTDAGQALFAPGSVQNDGMDLATEHDAAKAAHEDMEARYDDARDKRVVHENQGGRRNLGGRGFFGRFGNGEEYDAYQAIDTHWSTAEDLRRRGTEHELRARDFTRTDVDEAARSIAFWRHAAEHYLAAEDDFGEVVASYVAIERRHPDKPGYWR